MQRSHVLWVVAGLALAIASAGPATAEGKKKPRKSACQRLKANHRDRSPHPKLVLAVRGDSDYGNISACVLPRGKVRKLAVWEDGLGRDSAALVATKGYYVLATTSWRDQYGGRSHALHRFDARTGGEVTLAGYGCQTDFGRDCASGTTYRTVVLASSGAGAIELTDLSTQATTLQSFDRAGALAKLDDGPVEDLRIERAEIVWTRLGIERRAPLPG